MHVHLHIVNCIKTDISPIYTVADLESFVGGAEHLLAACGHWSLSKRHNSGSRSRSVLIHVISRLCLVTIST